MHFQLALVELLKSLGLTPDGILGHSLGEVACGYVNNNSLSLEQTIKCAYWRAKCVSEAGLPPGAMAAVGEIYTLLSLYYENICSTH